MVKKHELESLIHAGLREAIDTEQVIDVKCTMDGKDMILKFTEIDLEVSKFRLKIEPIFD